MMTSSQQESLGYVQIWIASGNIKTIIHIKASFDIALSNKRIILALISLRGCTGWSLPLLFACNRVRLSRNEAQL